MGFERFKFQHIKLRGTMVAHLLARQGFIRRRDFLWMEDKPESILEWVQRDRRGGV